MSGAFDEFLGSAVGSAAGFAAGVAVGPVLRPLLRALENESWSTYPDAPLDAILTARAVAEGKLTEAEGADEASLTGISNSRFAALVTFSRNGPGVAAAQELVRRGILDDAGFRTALQRAGLEDQWLAAYLTKGANGLFTWQQYLSPADLALGLIRGNLETFTAPSGPAFPPGLSSEGSNVPPDPVLGLDVVTEASASGVDADRMALLARNVGLPPGVIEGLNMLNRGIINEAAFALLIEQSDARLSWGPFLIQLRKMLLTARETVEARLRGYIGTDAEMYARTAQHGLDQTDTGLLFDITGRPLAVHQITTGLARGGVFGGDYEGVPEPYLTALRQSNIRPEWGNIAYSNRYTFPSAFVLRTLAQAGELGTAADVQQILLEIGWPPDFAAKVSAAWVPGGAAGPGTDSHLKSSITSAITAIRKKYLAGDLTAPIADQYIAAAEAAKTLTDVWDVVKSVDGLAAPPFQPADPALIAAVEAEGYTVTPPAPAPPQNVTELEALGYTVTPK